jgi:hypothetical protein
MKLILILISILIIGLFLYSKLLPHKDKLSPIYKNICEFFSPISSPIFTLPMKFIKPLQVRKGLSIDISQLILLIFFLR